jgi:toxin CcdB
MQFDVHPNPDPRKRKAYPFVAILQSNYADTGPERIVAFLAPRPILDADRARLSPTIVLAGQEFALLLPSITNVPTRTLRASVGSIAAHRDRIVDALDWLFLGI